MELYISCSQRSCPYTRQRRRRSRSKGRKNLDTKSRKGKGALVVKGADDTNNNEIVVENSPKL